jgi:polysaccharide export outer membrane protein
MNLLCGALAAVLMCVGGLGALLDARQGTQPTDYVIGAQDVLMITVYDQDDLTGKFPVDTDGTFTFPLIGRVKAGGLTLRALEAELKRRLMDGYFRDPQVSVAIEQYRSQRVFILGEVRNPGPYALSGNMSLIEAIALAGSALPTASGEALIVRAGSGDASKPTLPTSEKSEVETVDLKALQSGALEQNIALRDGDTIFVPRAETAFVFGQVKNPGAYAIQRETSVLQALSLAGGITDRGATGRIRIVRLEKGKRVELKAKLDDIVRPGDTIIVPERFF